MTAVVTKEDIKGNVVTLSGDLKNLSKIENGFIEVEGDAFYKTLPEGLDEKTVKTVLSHKADVVAALTLLTGEVGEETLKKDKSMESVSAHMKFGKFGDVNTSYTRSQVGRKTPTDPTEVTRYGTTSIRVREFSGRPRGELKKVRTMLTERAEKLFK